MGYDLRVLLRANRSYSTNLKTPPKLSQKNRPIHIFPRYYWQSFTIFQDFIDIASQII